MFIFIFLQAVCGVTEEDDLLVVETSQTSLQQKYSSLLDLSEKLTEELNKKNESFIVLEQRHMSLLESSKASQDIHEESDGSGNLWTSILLIRQMQNEISIKA